MSELKVNKVSPRSGTDVTLGDSGDTFTVPTGASLVATDELKTNKISPSSGTSFTFGDSGDTFTIPSGATITNSGTANGFGVALANDGNNRVVTATGSGGLNGEANLTFDGSSLEVSSSVPLIKLTDSDDSSFSRVYGSAGKLVLDADKGDDVADSEILFTVDDATKVKIDSTGHITPNTTNTQDLGSSSLVWRNIYTSDFHMSNEGLDKGNDIDGTKGSWTFQEGEENLYLINNKNGKKYKFNLTEIE